MCDGDGKGDRSTVAVLGEGDETAGVPMEEYKRVVVDDAMPLLEGMSVGGEDTLVVTVLVGGSDTCVIPVEVTDGVGVTDTSLVVSVPEEDTMVATLAVEPDEGDSVCKGGTVVASSPGEGDSVGEGESLVVSSPEEDTMVVTLAVEFVDGSDIGEVMIKPTEEAVTETWVIATLVAPTGEGDSVGEGVVLVVSIPEGDTMVVTLAVEFVDGSDIGEVMIKPTEEAVTETWVIATLVAPTGEGDSVGEGVVLVVSSPEEHTVVVTLAVELV
jgi:hypothetical protein